MIPPTDLELMMYHDGELEEPRCSELRALLEPNGASGPPGSGAQARAKLDGLSLLGDVLRESALSNPAAGSAAQADSIVDDVMSKIGALPAAAAPKALKIGLQPASRRAAATAPAANDNGRLIFGLSALAAAAAAALFLWGRTPVTEAPTASGTHTQGSEAPLEATAGRLPEPTVAQSSARPDGAGPADEQSDEGDPSAEIASVDFGSRAGAVYYVSGDNAGADGRSTTTTVVWLTDE